MRLNSMAGFQYAIHEGSVKDGLCIYFVGLPQELDELGASLEGLSCSVVYIVISDWDNQLTPWPAKGLYRGDADFKGQASYMLASVIEDFMPSVEQAHGLTPSRRAIAGYSLGGLFSVYAFANSRVFDDVASMSGSFWYEGWVEYLSGLSEERQGSFAYLSLGKKESHARERILHSVQANTDATAEILKSWGVRVEKRMVPGGHFDDINERISNGLKALAAQ